MHRPQPPVVYHFGPGFSGGGVVVTRDPLTGEKRLAGEFFLEDPGRKGSRRAVRRARPLDALQEEHPEAHAALAHAVKALEARAGSVLAVDFSVRDGGLRIEGSQPAELTPLAAVRTAVDMAEEGLIERADALRRVDVRDVEALMHPGLAPAAETAMELLTKGAATSPGAASGRLALSAEDALRRAARGEAVILVRPDIRVPDLPALEAVAGLLLVGGGLASHGAILGRGAGIVCIVGSGDLHIDEGEERLRLSDGREVGAGEWITLDGASGSVWRGRAEVVSPRPPAGAEKLLAWADQVRTLRVRANADTGRAAATAVAMGAEGIGLCRTEHLFYSPGRFDALRALMVAPEGERRAGLLREMAGWMRADLREVFVAADHRPVAVRLLDIPFSEWEPEGAEDYARLAAMLSMEEGELRRRIAGMREANPMMGRRGARMAVQRPDIYEAQVEGIVEAAADAEREGARPVPEIIVPFVTRASEWRFLKNRLAARVEQAAARRGIRLPCRWGIMVEVPRAALTAHQFAGDVDFLSFGTNDLTQMTLGTCRGTGAGLFLAYDRLGIETGGDPFRTLDVDGVGVLVETAVARARGVKPGTGAGLCGEHGGDPASIAFCHRIGVDYVSCAPDRVPAARLAAARAALDLPAGRRA